MYILNKKLSILKKSVDYIQTAEVILKEYNLDADLVLDIIMESKNIDSIKKTLKICKENNIEISSKLFNTDINNLISKINLAKNLNIPFFPVLITYSAYYITNITEYLNKNNIKVSAVFYNQNFDEFKKKINLLEKII